MAADPVAGTATATPAVAEKPHSLKIEIGSEDAGLTPEMKKQLSPEQLYQLELARLESRDGNFLGSESLVPILVPFGFFAMTFAIVAIIVWSRSRRQRLLHDTVRLLVEKGQPLPEEIFQQNFQKPKSDLRRGIIWSSIGVGLIAYFLVDRSTTWPVGFIPLCLGLGFLLSWKLDRSAKPDSAA